jgi:hypothetical protein
MRGTAVFFILCSLQSAMAQEAPSRAAQTKQLFQGKNITVLRVTPWSRRSRGDFWMPDEFERMRGGVHVETPQSN